MTAILAAAKKDESTDFLQQFLDFLTGAGINLLFITGYIVGAFLIAWMLRFLIRRIVHRVVSGAKTRARVDDTQALVASPLAAARIVQRTRTLGAILQNFVNVVVAIVALLLITHLLIPDIFTSLTLLTAALGAGLGFGAQNIVKDVLNGIFIVAGDQVGIGDVVDLGLATGIVEFVSVRVTHVRGIDGTLWYVRNGEILRIGNKSQGWARAIVDVPLAATADISAAEALILSTAESMVGEPEWAPKVMEMPSVWGFDALSGDTVVLRLVVKTRVTASDNVTRELRRRVKAALDDASIPMTTVPVEDA